MNFLKLDLYMLNNLLLNLSARAVLYLFVPKSLRGFHREGGATDLHQEDGHRQSVLL